MGTPFTPGQFGKLQSVVGIGVATALPKLAEKYDPKVVLKALDGKGEIFAGRLQLALEQVLNSMLVLVPRGMRTITLTERHDPDTFYQTRSGLYVWGDFHSQIVVRAKPTEAGATFRVESFDLTANLTDEKIEDFLPKAHFFDETKLCGTIAGLIARQPNGEVGELVNNGYANLFYTVSYVVLVRWDAGRRRWIVGTWRRGAFRWRAGRRVFSPGN